jgi:hypothetical protein
MTLATRYSVDPTRLPRLLRSLDMAATDAAMDAALHPYGPIGSIVRHEELGDLALLRTYLCALVAAGHLELEVVR